MSPWGQGGVGNTAGGEGFLNTMPFPRFTTSKGQVLPWLYKGSKTSTKGMVPPSKRVEQGPNTWGMGHRGATTTGPDATRPPAIFQNSGGGAVGGGVQPGVGGGFLLGSEGGGVFLPGAGGGVWPGVMGVSSQG